MDAAVGRVCVVGSACGSEDPLSRFVLVNEVYEQKIFYE